MRILVFGATGRTGLCVLEAARARGAAVGAFVRDRARLPPGPFEVHEGDVSRAADVEAALRPGDAVVSCLGGAGMGAGAATLVAAMKRVGASRFVGVVGAGVLQFDAATRRNQRPDYPEGFRAIGREHQAVHDALAGSGLEWTLVATPRLLDGPVTGRMVRRADYLPEGSGSVTTGDVAALLVEEALRPKGSGRIGVNQS